VPPAPARRVPPLSLSARPAPAIAVKLQRNRWSLCPQGTGVGELDTVARGPARLTAQRGVECHRPEYGHVRWHRKLEGAVTAGPVIGQDGTIYAASNGGVLHALDPATGTDRWTYDSGHTDRADLSISPLVLPDRTVLWPTPGAELVALSPTGRPPWPQPLPGQPTSPASADGQRSYVGDLSGAVSALDVMGVDDKDL
jgi:outer membrane protein assembly factor BamB